MAPSVDFERAICCWLKTRAARVTSRVSSVIQWQSWSSPRTTETEIPVDSPRGANRMLHDIHKEEDPAMSLRACKTLIVPLALVLSGFAFHPRAASAPALPNPDLYLVGTETFQASGKTYTRYKYDIRNKDPYPAQMFAAAPDLPPCGKNTKASRTWVDFFDQSGKRLYGFCALSKPADLNGIWFALEDGQLPPSYVYIEMTDRKTNTTYKSNLADTTM